MSIQAACFCGHKFKVNAQYAGRLVACPKCGNGVAVPMKAARVQGASSGFNAKPLIIGGVAVVVLALLVGVIVVAVSLLSRGKSLNNISTSVAVALSDIEFDVRNEGVPAAEFEELRSRVAAKIAAEKYDMPIKVRLSAKATRRDTQAPQRDDDGEPTTGKINVSVPYVEVAIQVEAPKTQASLSSTHQYYGAVADIGGSLEEITRASEKLSWQHFLKVADKFAPPAAQALRTSTRGGGSGPYHLPTELAKEQPASPIERYVYVLLKKRLADELRLTLPQRVELAMLKGSFTGYQFVPGMPDRGREVRDVHAYLAAVGRQTRDLLTPDQQKKFRAIAARENFALPKVTVSNYRKKDNPTNKAYAWIERWEWKMQTSDYGPELPYPPQLPSLEEFDRADPIAMGNRLRDDAYSLAKAEIQKPEDIEQLFPTGRPYIRLFVYQYLIRQASVSPKVLALIRKELIPWGDLRKDNDKRLFRGEELLLLRVYVKHSGPEADADILAIAEALDYDPAWERLVMSDFPRMEAYVKKQIAAGERPKGVGWMPEDMRNEEALRRLEQLKKIASEGERERQKRQAELDAIEGRDPPFEKVLSSLEGKGPWSVGTALARVPNSRIPLDKMDAVRELVLVSVRKDLRFPDKGNALRALAFVSKKEDADLFVEKFEAAAIDQERAQLLLMVAMCDPPRGMALLEKHWTQGLEFGVGGAAAPHVLAARNDEFGKALLQSRHKQVRQTAAVTLIRYGSKDAMPAFKQAMAKETNSHLRDYMKNQLPVWEKRLAEQK